MKQKIKVRFEGVHQAFRGNHVTVDADKLAKGATGRDHPSYRAILEQACDLLDRAPFEAADIDIDYSPDGVTVKLTPRADVAKAETARQRAEDRRLATLNSAGG